jgi:hypothetical protein
LHLPTIRKNHEAQARSLPPRREASLPHSAQRLAASSRARRESSRDNLSVIAAGCAFYALFAIFPGLSALISLYGLTADPTTIEQQVGGFASVLPAEAYNLVIGQSGSGSARLGIRHLGLAARIGRLFVLRLELRPL